MAELYPDLTPYEAARAEEQDQDEPVKGGFSMCGQTFDTLTSLPPIVLLDYATLVERNQLAATMMFLRAALVPESWERFDALLHDPDHPEVVQSLGQVVAAVMGRLTARPTTPPSRSAGGSSSTGKKSRGGSSTAAGLRSA